MNKIMSMTLLLISPFSFAKMHIIPLQQTADGHLEIQATINEVQGTFILDTGATGTLIDLNQLAKFGLQKNDESMVGIRSGDQDSGTIETFTVEVKSFSINGHKININSIYANDTSGQFEPSVVGLIGQDALTKLEALLDLKVPRLLIPETPEDLEELLGDSQTPKYETIQIQRSDMGFSFVDITLNQHELRLLVDSGASETVLDQSVLTQLGFTLGQHPTAKSIVAEGIELPMTVLRGSTIHLGKAQLKGDFFASDFSALMQTINQDQQRLFVGVLGNKQLVELNSIVDLSKRKLYIKP